MTTSRRPPEPTVRRDVNLETPFGRYTLVPRESVMALDDESARRMLTEALAEPGGPAALRESARQLGLAADQDEAQLVAELARALASGRVRAIELEEPRGGLRPPLSGADDWDDIPRLRDLILDPPLSDLSIAIVFDDRTVVTGASYELELPDARRLEGRVDAGGRVRETAVPDGTCRLKLSGIIPPVRAPSAGGGGVA